MTQEYPTLEDANVSIPYGVKEDLFREGWDHSLRGGQLTDITKHFKKSFRYGFRTAKLYLNDVRKAEGIIPFPMKQKMSTRVK
jgi:hypothetical protein